MDHDNANHLETIFFAALDIHDPEARASYLAENCGQDVELRQRIDQMLAIQSKVGSFMENPPVAFEGTIDLDKKILEAGLTAGLREDQAVVIGSANHSVLKSLSRTLTEMPRVMLRDPKEVGIDPIVRPRSKEIPADHSESRYRLDGEIARGGMGAIIKGRDVDLGRDLAIKVLLDSHKDKPDVIQRFIEEAQIGGQLQHPGIVPVYELGQFGDERPFFSMKLVKGQTLAQVLGARKHLSEDRAKYLGIFEQICQTMAYAHSRGVIHRDLKPANIMVGAFGEVQVMDWGLAKVLAVGGIADEKRSLEKQTEVSIIRTLRSVGSDSPGSLGSQTQMGSVMGTPAYMSPEQALGEVDRLDERTDVFGLGAILCEILTGKPPYVGASGEQVFRMASRGKLEDCYARLDATIIDPELLQIVRDALSLEPDDRLRDAGVLAERFSKYLESVENRLRQAEIDRATETARAEEALKTAAQELVSRKEAQGRVVEEMRRRRVTMALAASLLIGAIVSGWFAVHAGRQRSLAFIAQQQADQERKVADLARKTAEGSEQTAIVERDKASTLNTELTRTKENQRRMLYGAQMNLVQKAWEMDDAIQVQKLLNATRHRPGETDLRGIEWHYWQLKLHEEDRVLQLPLRLVYRGVRDLPSDFRSGSPPKDVAQGTPLSHDGRRLAAITRSDDPSNTDLVLKVWSTESDSIEPIFSGNLPYKTVPTFPAGTTRARTNTPQDRRDSCRIEFLDAERVVISASSELQTFRLDATAEAQPAQVHPPIKGLKSLKFNGDGSRIAATAITSQDGESNPQSTILILDGRTGEQIDQFPNLIPNATVRALSPDATRMVVVQSLRAPFQSGVQTNPGPDLQFAIVDVATRNSVTVSPRSMRNLNTHPAAGAVGIEFSPDGTRLAVDHPASGSVTIVDAATGSELFSIPNNAHSFDTNSRLSSSGTSFGFTPAPFVAFSPDGKWLTSTSGIDQATNGLKVWEAATGKLGTEFKGHTSAPLRVAFSADSTHLLVADLDCEVKVWRLPAKTPSEASETIASAAARQNGDILPPARITAISSDRRWTASAPASSLAMAGQGGPSANWTSGEPPFEVELNDASGRIPTQVLPLAAPAEKLTFSPDGSLLVSLSVDESVKLDEAAELKVWSVATGKLATLPPLRFRAKGYDLSKDRYSDASFFLSPDSRRLVSVFASSDTGGEQPMTIRIWDLDAGRELPVAMAKPLLSSPKPKPLDNSPTGSTRSASAVSFVNLTFSSDSKLFLIANFRGNISEVQRVQTTGFQILDAATGALRWAQDSPVASPVFSSDASRLAGIRISTDVGGGLPSAAIVVWEAATGKEVGEIPLPTNHSVLTLAVNNKGTHIAASAKDSVTLYDVATATPLHAWDSSYSGLWFAPDGQRLVANCYSDLPKEVKVWDVETRQEILSRKFMNAGSAGTGVSMGVDAGTTTGLRSLPAQAEAEGLVDWLSAADGDGRFLTRSQIAEQIKTDPFVSVEAKTIALEMASNVRRSAEALSMQASKILNSPIQPRDEYQLALDWINEAVEQDKENSSYASYQGIAYYRLGKYADALTALARSKELHAAQKLSPSAEDLTILAMAQHQAGQLNEARTTLEQARTSASRNKLTGQKLLAEAETLLVVPHVSIPARP